ncbi:MAG: Rdx family protein [Alphaproteobacteria bacterium]|uniref:Rdx family protein n=1 Tax=Candidatus Nitrobium versatile TaxID=2884831 RepID=A0A953J913_9BACT|nr:Rdx family protein [Candidatus Nitrobium versatile]
MNQENAKAGSSVKDVAIEYCVTCNFRPMAAVLAKQVEMELGVKPELVPSTVSGAFEIKADNEMVFSKTQSGRFPQQGEVVQILKSKTKRE